MFAQLTVKTRFQKVDSRSPANTNIVSLSFLVNDNILINKQDHKLAVKTNQFTVVAGIAADWTTQKKRGQVTIFPSILIHAAIALRRPSEELTGNALVFIVPVHEMTRLLLGCHCDHQLLTTFLYFLSEHT
jgi:hypothetical protein